MPSCKVVFEGQTMQVPSGARIAELLGRRTRREGPYPVGALLNQRLVGLEQEVFDGAVIQPVDPDEPNGLQICNRSICLLMFEAFRRVAPEVPVRAGQPVGDWLYFEIDGPREGTGETLARVVSEMTALMENDEPFESARGSTEQAVRQFESQGRSDRAALLQTWWHESIRLVRVGRYLDLALGPTVPSAKYLPGFALHPYNGGFVLGLAVPGRTLADLAAPPPLLPGLMGIYQETQIWNRELGISTVGDLNRACVSEREFRQVIQVAEGFHERKIVSMADEIRRRGDGARLVLVAGPSSSGKTTFAKRLGVQLRVIGLRPVTLSTDDYYIDRERTPPGEDGKPDFEALDAVDLALFNEHLERLLRGEEVATPRYDFPSGRRIPEAKWPVTRLGERDVLMVEGIHGLNDRLTAAVPASRKYRIYVSALTQLSIDAHTRISTSDTRLLRRLVRDCLYRGHRPPHTLAVWPSVRRGEQKWIFPYQESADAMMNTALVYELAVLKVFAHRFLLEVPGTDPGFAEAYRLLKFLELFVPIFPEKVPQNSIIREFIGGSSFHYGA